jgi:hypothetical protein
MKYKKILVGHKTNKGRILNKSPLKNATSLSGDIAEEVETA